MTSHTKAKGGRPTQRIELVDAERELLTAVTQHACSTRLEVKRAKAILLCAEGRNDTEVSSLVDGNAQSVGRWRKSFVEGRLSGVKLLPGSSKPHKLDARMVAEVIGLTLENSSGKRSNCSTRFVARLCKISNTSVSHIWKTFGLTPYIRDNLRVLNSYLLDKKISDVAGLYMSSRHNALVLCGKAELPWQSTKLRVQNLKGMDKVRDGLLDDRRHCDLPEFALLALKTSGVHNEASQFTSEERLLNFLVQIESSRSAGVEYHIVLDKQVLAKATRLHQWMSLHPHWHFHFVAHRSNWLIHVERTLVQIKQAQAELGMTRNSSQLKADVLHYLQTNQAMVMPFHWCNQDVSSLQKLTA